MHAQCRQLIPKSEERREQREACPASSLKLTSQTNHCSFPSLSDQLRGRVAQHITLAQIPPCGRKQQGWRQDVLSSVPDSAGHEQNQFLSW